MNWLTDLLDEMIEDTRRGRVAIGIAIALVVAMMVAISAAVLAVGAPQ